MESGFAVMVAREGKRLQSYRFGMDGDISGWESRPSSLLGSVKIHQKRGDPIVPLLQPSFALCFREVHVGLGESPERSVKGSELSVSVRML